VAAASAAAALPQDAVARNSWLLIAAGLVAAAAAGGVALAMNELDAFYLTLGAVLCIAVMMDFRVGAVALVVLLPLSDAALFPHALLGITGLNPMNLLLAATLASYVIHGRLQRAGRVVRWPLVWLYLVPIVVGGLLGAPHADDVLPYFHEAMLINFTGPGSYLRDMLMKPMLIMIVALMIGAAAARSQKPERFIVPIALSVWFIAIIQFSFVLASGVKLSTLAAPSAREFFTQMGIHANSLGRLYAAAYALLLFSWWETKRPGLRIFLFITMGVLAFGLLLTFSRGAFTGFLIVNALFLLWKFNMKTAALALAAAAIFAIFAPGYVFGRVLLGFDTGDANAVSAGRINEIWMPLMPELWKSPIWGNGLGSVMWSFPMLAGMMNTVDHPHNAYLEAVLDIGVVGLGLLLAYFWHVWNGFRKLGSNAYLSPEMRGFFQGATAGLICFLVTGMSGSTLRPSSEFVYLFMAIGLMYGVLARRPAG
jgi:O-antigen ligase